jgi:hypothetical protein
MVEIDRNEYPSIEFIHAMSAILGIGVDETKTVFEQSDMYSIGLTGLWETWKHGKKVGRQECRKDYRIQ